MSVLAPLISPLGLSPKMFGDNITKVSGDWKGVRITEKLAIQNRQARLRSCLCPDHHDPQRATKRQKGAKKKKIVEISLLMRLSTCPTDAALIFS